MQRAAILGCPSPRKAHWNWPAAPAARRASPTVCQACPRLCHRAGDGTIDGETAIAARKWMDIDEAGLDELDRSLLRAIIEMYNNGGPVSLDTLAAVLGEESVTLYDVCEPYLMQMGMLTPHPARPLRDPPCLRAPAWPKFQALRRRGQRPDEVCLKVLKSRREVDTFVQMAYRRARAVARLRRDLPQICLRRVQGGVPRHVFVPRCSCSTVTPARTARTRGYSVTGIRIGRSPSVGG